MTWTRHSDDYSDRAEIMRLSDAAYRAHDAALIWCNRQLSGGHVPTLAVPVVLAYVRGDHRDAVDELEQAGLWVRVEDGWEIDWADQEDSESVRARRERNAARQAEYRERSSRHRNGDHSMCDTAKCKGAKVEEGLRNELHATPRNALRNTSRYGAPTHPNPTQPSPSSLEEGAGLADGRPSADAPGATAEDGAPDHDGNRVPTTDPDWDDGRWMPRGYMWDPWNPQFGGWTEGHTAWTTPDVWRDGWGHGRRPAQVEAS